MKVKAYDKINHVECSIRDEHGIEQLFELLVRQQLHTKEQYCVRCGKKG